MARVLLIAVVVVGFALCAAAGFSGDTIEFCGHNYNVSHIIQAYKNNTLASLTIPLLPRRNITSMTASERIGYGTLLMELLGWQEPNCHLFADPNDTVFVQKRIDTIMILIFAAG